MTKSNQFQEAGQDQMIEMEDQLQANAISELRGKLEELESYAYQVKKLMRN